MFSQQERDLPHRELNRLCSHAQVCLVIRDLPGDDLGLIRRQASDHTEHKSEIEGDMQATIFKFEK